MKILLLEDEVLLRRNISSYLTKRGFEVVDFEDGRTLLESANLYDFDAFVLDINVPDFNGFEILEFIKNSDPKTPVILISAYTETKDVLNGFKLGCSDYVKKPFDVKELELKILAMTQKRSEMIQLAGDLSYDKTSHKLFYGAEEIDLTKNESKLIHLLVANRGKLVGFDQISYAIWGNDDTPHIRQLVMRLSKKIPVKLIENRRDMGYFIK
ncbi:MAG: response regulator transcription factor [Campylobacterales bacterium]